MNRSVPESTHCVKNVQGPRGARIKKAENHARAKTPLKVLSWNIHDASTIEGKKIEDENFIKIIRKADIFCLQETKGEIKIPNYRCFNS